MYRNGLAVAGAFAAVLSLAACAGGSEPVAIDETYDTDRVVLRDFIGTLDIVTSAEGSATAVHADLRRNQVDLLPITQSGGTLTIEWDGEPDRTRRWWEFWRGRWMADLDRLEDYPHLVLEIPVDVAVEIDSIIGEWTIDDRPGHIVFNAERGSGSIGAVGSADISIDGHAELDLGAVAGALEVAIAGSGTLAGSTVGTAGVSIAGSGKVDLGDVDETMSVSIAGSGEARIGDSAGAEVQISGSGDVAIGAVSGGLRAIVLGSGDIDAAAVNGAFSAAISGSGEINVEAGRGDPFEVAISGSGDVRFGGTGVDVDAALSGSGNLFLGALEGNLDARTSGSGRVEVGER